MKDSSLAVSLGLAAIDGLTCAFIAILILALILIGRGCHRVPMTLTRANLTVHVAADGTAPRRYRSTSLVDVNVDGDPQHTAAFNVESAGGIVKLDAMGEYVPAGGVWWKDCQTVKANECFAQKCLSPKLSGRTHLENSFESSR